MTIHRAVCLTILLTPILAHSSGAPLPGSGDSRCVLDPAWPQKPAAFAWGAMSGVTVDERDQVYTFNRSEPTVQVYGMDGTLIRSWSTANPKGTHHIRLGPDGSVWVTDFRSHLVQKYSPGGKLLLTLGTANQKGCDESHFSGPTDIAFLSNGDVFISDGYGNRRVVRFDGRGRFIKAWGNEGTGPGQFALPHSIAVNSKDRVYVADRNNGRIQVFDADGNVLAVWDGLLMPWGLTMTRQDEIWVCGSSRVRQPDGSGWVVSPPPDQLLMKLDSAGKVLLRAALNKPAVPPAKPGEVDWVHAVALDSKGNIYLGDIEGKRVQRFFLHPASGSSCP
ncbi:MAG TPA: peptidyl-alpha-hydroxyglycine alpha-amidating lyase family protein [Verrucomicrobiae bacterium]|nr:peptidyl-alpha-hydroxyglycine alpha-amidating lyase family protein [Verrucomicrobiae bacterium]